MPDTLTPEALNATHGLPGQLDFVAGPGGGPCAQIHNGLARATVSLHGGQVLSFRPDGAGDDLLFLSERALYQPGKAIRGGVPVCWPWFGPDPLGLGRPAHGLARTRRWAVVGTAAALPGGATRLTLELRDSDETRALWPHAFRLTLEITVGRSLRLALTTLNTGDAAFSVTQALHSYFAVGDIGSARVSGLDGCACTDKVAGRATGPQTGDVRFDGEVDRVFHGVPPVLDLTDPSLRRTIRIRSEGSRTAVVWNPGEAVAAGFADLADGDWRRFACVETANAGDEVITLPPGGEHRLVAEIGLAG